MWLFKALLLRVGIELLRRPVWLVAPGEQLNFVVLYIIAHCDSLSSSDPFSSTRAALMSLRAQQFSAELRAT